jgi:hypothetical protein
MMAGIHLRVVKKQPIRAAIFEVSTLLGCLTLKHPE